MDDRLSGRRRILGRYFCIHAGTQIGALSLDSVPTPELLEEIRTMEGVKYAKPVALPKVHELPVWLN